MNKAFPLGAKEPFTLNEYRPQHIRAGEHFVSGIIDDLRRGFVCLRNTHTSTTVDVPLSAKVPDGIR